MNKSSSLGFSTSCNGQFAQHIPRHLHTEAMQALRALTSYKIDSEIEIEATPEQVWKVFGDFASWGKWNDFTVFKEVPEQVGKRCQVVFHLDGGCMKSTSHDPEVREHS